MAQGVCAPHARGKRRPARGSRAALLALLALLVDSAAAAAAPAYRLTATVDPAAQSLRTTAEIRLPPERAGETIEFLLGDDFELLGSAPAAERLPASESDAAFVGINSPGAAAGSVPGVRRYRVTLPAGVSELRVEYHGLVATPPAASAEEYARSFAETPGIIEPRGLYLAGSTVWYPQLVAPAAGELLTFSLVVNTPPGWQLIAPGNGVTSGPDGLARWESPAAVDEISLAGGPLIAYTAKAGPVQAQVYLREADAALAGRYLDATARYLRMYGELLGPYPYEKFALVENFWETGYGMPSYTLLGPQVIRFPFIIESSYPHEILHNWWGNSVYVDYASGNWAEGLTAYLADHLMQEAAGRGADYRRDVLKKYRDFAASGADFPLRDFRARHSGATEAVGYGKTLMGFHMLRRQLGDEAFRAALALFYKEQRGRQASFADLRSAFEQTAGSDLGRFFTEWTTRTGAADLALEAVRVTRRGERHVVTGVIRQRQPEAYALDIPVIVNTATGPVAATVASRAATTDFAIEVTGEPRSLAVDPEFDLFRLLDPRETAPSLGQLFGAGEVLAVLPAGDGEQAAWRTLLDAWRNPANRLDVVTDRDLARLPADRSVWLFGRSNRFAATLFGGEPAPGLRVGDATVGIGASEWPFAGHSLVLTRRHPRAPGFAVGWVTADPPQALAGLGRKLPHYGKYSWLAFEGLEPANVGKGEWNTPDSPLLVRLAGAGEPQAAAPAKRLPLAQPPATYSAERLMQHVRFLAAPEREGRGFGSAGLEAAAEYIAGQFAAAGLRPAGDDGFFQPFTVTGGAEQRETRLRNVIGVLPGTDPRFAGEAALLTAHYDHLGYGWPGVRQESAGQMHPGADDNASGVAVLLEVARTLAAGPPPARTIAFIAFSAEEAGRLGSIHYASQPVPVPLDKIVGVINMDTVGHLGEQPLSVLASGSAREWPFAFRGITAMTGVPTRTIEGASESSDQQSFIDRGVPGVQLFTSPTLDYHRPGDTADKVDGAGLAKVALVATEAIGWLAATDKRLSFTGGASAPAPPGGSAGRRVSLGAVPDFAHQGAGLRIDGVVPGSPADRAGLRPGDVLTALDGHEIAGLSGFNELLKGHQPGDRVTIQWQRGDTRREAEVELVER